MATERVLAIVLDRAHARFFDVAPGEARELDGIGSPAMRGGRFHSDRQGGPGWGEREYHGRIHEEERRHVRRILSRIAQLERRASQPLLVAGPKTSVAALVRSLPSPLADRLIGEVRLNPTAVTPSIVREAVDAARTRQRPATERALVMKMRRGLGTGRSTNGLRETLHALGRRQVRTLLVVDGTRLSGFRCARSHRLALTRSECEEEGPALRVRDLIRAAEGDALAQNAAVVIVRDPGTRTEVDGLAALLRWSE
ncbi:MAG TPA: hypothetical protein VLT79_05210 [Gemmatimonadales bacterium]|nr:hypothetical protein [Gemmatimonadales bacterium]